MSDDALTAQIYDELARIVAVVSELTGLPSNWNGQLVLVPDANFHGKKLYSCGILISMDLVASPLRWRTLIHEALHAASVGYNRSDYDAATGWEEGVVEQLQRLLRHRVLTRLGITVDEQALTVYEATHRFNDRIASLERLRLALKQQDETQFYLELLSTPIKDRPGLIVAQSNQMNKRDRVNFLLLFSAENSLLRSDVRGI